VVAQKIRERSYSAIAFGTSGYALISVCGGEQGEPPRLSGFNLTRGPALPLVLRRVLSDTCAVVTLRTWTFAISFIQPSTPVAHALICPDVRYIAVRWQDGRLDRRPVPASLWLVLEQELARDLTAEPVSRSSAISTVLVGSMGALMVVSFIETRPVDVGRLEDPETVLDGATRFSQPV